MRETYSDNHPELRPGEVWIGNFTIDTFENVGWKSKRQGRVAFDIVGASIKPQFGLFPVFVKREELEAAGVNPDE